MKATFSTPSITCEGCANSIKQALNKFPGVFGVKVDVAAKTVTVLGDDSITPAQVVATLKQVGHPAASP